MKYRAKISGPLMDRIDLQIEVPAVEYQAGWAAHGPHCNGQMGPSEIRRHFRPSREVAGRLQRDLDRLAMSARTYHRVLKVSRALADLEGVEEIRLRHAAEAIQYRGLDPQVGG